MSQVVALKRDTMGRTAPVGILCTIENRCVVPQKTALYYAYGSDFWA